MKQSLHPHFGPERLEGTPQANPRENQTEKLLDELQQEMEQHEDLGLERFVLSAIVNVKKAMESMNVFQKEGSLPMLLTGVDMIDQYISSVLDKVAKKSPRAARIVEELRKSQHLVEGQRENIGHNTTEQEGRLSDLFSSILDKYPGARTSIENLGYSEGDVDRFLSGIMQLESTNNPRAVSRSGAYGLFQMLPGFYNDEFMPWATKDTKSLGFAVKAEKTLNGSSPESQFGVALYNLLFRVKLYSDSTEITKWRTLIRDHGDAILPRVKDKKISGMGPMEKILTSMTDREIPFFLAAMNWNVGGGAVAHILRSGTFPNNSEHPLAYGAAMVAKLRGYSFKNEEIVG